ncbi:MAG: chromate transporter [Candidatus Brocadiia bacterium]
MIQKLWLLTASFAIIGIGAYGGGLVTVPLMQRELTQNRSLLTKEEFPKIVAVAQMTPGPIAVNGATFAGYRVAGLLGALVATSVVVFPGLLVVVALSHLRQTVPPNEHLKRLRRGLRAGVLSLLLFAVWAYGDGVITGLPELALAVGAFIVLVLFQRKLHPLAVIVASGVVGLFVF